MSETSLAVRPQIDFSPEKIALITRTIAKGATPDELDLFLAQCQRTGLDPFARQIYSVRRKQWNSSSRSYEEAQVIQVSIDGFRLIADRTTKYAGQVGPWWCGRDGEWKEVWLEDEPPAAAKVGVLRHDFHQPLYSIALYKSYVQTNNSGDAISRWKTDPAGMLAKCAEALALRRAFPNDLSGLYTTEEMGQVSNGQPEAVTTTWEPAPDPQPVDDVPIVTHPAPAVPAPKTNGNGHTPQAAGTVPVDQRPDAKLLKRWSEIAAEARAWKIEVETISPDTITAAALIEKGKALKAKIEQAEIAEDQAALDDALMSAPDHENE